MYIKFKINKDSINYNYANVKTNIDLFKFKKTYHDVQIIEPEIVELNLETIYQNGSKQSCVICNKNGKIWYCFYYSDILKKLPLLTGMTKFIIDKQNKYTGWSKCNIDYNIVIFDKINDKLIGYIDESGDEPQEVLLEIKNRKVIKTIL